MGRYDRTIKSLTESHPEAVARFVLHQWHKQTGADTSQFPITSVKLLSEEFPDKDLKGDGVMLVEGPAGPLYLLEVEYQSTLDSTMPVRSLEYLACAKKKHEKVCAELPVLGAVIYLLNENNMPDCPLHWPAPGERTAMIYNYLLINIKQLPRAELLALQEPALWPLALLAKEPVDRPLIKTMFAELLEQKLYSTLLLGHTVATWILRKDDLVWLHEEYQQMFDIFRDSPTFQWMEESIHKKVKREFDEKQKKAEQQMVAIHQQTVLAIVSERFPRLKRLAKVQIRTLKQVELLQKVIPRLALARDEHDAEDVLFSLQAEEENEEQA